MKPRKMNLAKSRLSSHRSLLRYLDKKSKHLRQAIQQEEELIKMSGETRGAILDEASEVTEQMQSMALLEQFRRELRQVEATLQRIKEGRYGICKDCGRPILMARLRALPYATRCVSCQKLAGPVTTQFLPNDGKTGEPGR